MRALVLLALAILGMTCVRAAEPTEPKARRPHWNVRVELLMVAAPQEKVLKILPALRDPKTIAANVGELLAAVRLKEATLLGHPIVQTVDRQRSVSETTEEKRYSVDADPADKAVQPADPSQFPGGGQSAPNLAETRNLGATLEVKATVARNGEFIQVEIVGQRVAFLGWEKIENPKGTGTAFVKGAQPQFSDSKVQTTTSVPNGGHLLPGVHVLTKPEGYMEVFIVHAAATPIK